MTSDKSPAVALTPDVSTTPIGLGLASLFHEPSSKRRLELIRLAVDCGIGHFDVAPMYGLGRAELELGQALHRRRSDVTIATKFGIRPSRLGLAAGRVQRPVRSLLSASHGLGAAAQTSAPGPSSLMGSLIYRQDPYDAASAERTLLSSLRALGTDYLDIWLLHEPDLASTRIEDVCSYLEDVRVRGLIRTWGIAGRSDCSEPLATGIPLWQRPYLLDQPQSLDPGGIWFGALGPALARIRTAFSEPGVQSRWSEELGCDCSDTDVLVTLVLQCVRSDHPDGVVLYSSIRPGRIRSAARLSALAPLGGDVVERFQTLFRQIDVPALSAREPAEVR